MKIKSIKFYQSIKCASKEGASGKSEYTYLDSEIPTTPYDIELKTDLIYIRHRETKELTITGMNNVVYFKPYDNNK